MSEENDRVVQSMTEDELEEAKRGVLAQDTMNCGVQKRGCGEILHYVPGLHDTLP